MIIGPQRTPGTVVSLPRSGWFTKITSRMHRQWKTRGTDGILTKYNSKSCLRLRRLLKKHIVDWQKLKFLEGLSSVTSGIKPAQPFIKHGGGNMMVYMAASLLQDHLGLPQLMEPWILISNTSACPSFSVQPYVKIFAHESWQMWLALS